RPAPCCSPTPGSTPSQRAPAATSGSRLRSQCSPSCRWPESVSPWPSRRVRIDGDVRRQRLRPLTEAEAYARCHGTRDWEVRIVRIEPRRPRYQLEVSGEDLRRSFEEKLERREPEDEAVGGTA